MATFQHKEIAHVFDIFSGKTLALEKDRHILRLSPESNGLSKLYGNANPGKLCRIKNISQTIQTDGFVADLIP
jgi:hypothetical protein